MTIHQLDDYREGEYLFAALAMCLSCQKRWVAGVPAETSLFKLECPACHVQDSFASILPSEYLTNFGVGSKAEVDPEIDSDDYDPTPWCAQCGAMRARNCNCGPIAENN